MTPALKTLKTQSKNGVLEVSLARPDVRNAFNNELIAELKNTFEQAGKDSKVRVIVFRGEGKLFCAGGDLKWMQDSAKLTGANNLAETRKLTQMFAALNACPKPVIGLVHGAAIGGGVGLVSICDYVVASKETVFSLSEVRLGIIPACIGPFVLSKIGPSHARAYFISAERFLAPRALEIGLVHELVNSPADLDGVRDRIVENLLQCGPNAMAAAKNLIGDLKEKPFDESLEYVAKTLADLRVLPEAQEGFKAFFEKRSPSWSNHNLADK
jgi:methylglutaconyl-CoA hydratase